MIFPRFTTQPIYQKSRPHQKSPRLQPLEFSEWETMERLGNAIIVGVSFSIERVTYGFSALMNATIKHLYGQCFNSKSLYK